MCRFNFYIEGRGDQIAPMFKGMFMDIRVMAQFSPDHLAVPRVSLGQSQIPGRSVRLFRGPLEMGSSYS